jgi:hypothetical protein
MELVVKNATSKVLINDEMYNTRDKSCPMKDTT